MKKRLLLMVAMLFASIGMAMAQTLTVTGTVVAEKDGQPIAGAYVLVNGTTLGTITNEFGEFGIREVPADAKEIIVTFLGMSTASAPVQAEPVKVVMKEDQNFLDETIVVAYGVQKKSSFVGSATQLSGQKLETMQTSNVAKSLRRCCSRSPDFKLYWYSRFGLDYHHPWIRFSISFSVSTHRS